MACVAAATCDSGCDDAVKRAGMMHVVHALASLNTNVAASDDGPKQCAKQHALSESRDKLASRITHC